MGFRLEIDPVQSKTVTRRESIEISRAAGEATDWVWAMNKVANRRERARDLLNHQRFVATGRLLEIITHPSLPRRGSNSSYMDSAPDLLPSAFFSPSKAKQQRAQAQDWQHVDTWLASKFQGRSIPQFERNDDTLKALLALVAANEKADEERDLLWNVQKEALSELHARKVSHFTKLHLRPG